MNKELEKLDRLAEFIYNCIYVRRYKNKRRLKWALKLGMIAKEDLIHQAKYFGTCRNANQAIWDKDKNEFIYDRHKFGDTFEDSVPYPEDADRSEDIFVPVKKIE